MAAILTLLSSFATAMLGIWGDVVTFVTTADNSIVLIGLVAWLFVMATGGILRLIRGV